MPANEKQQPIIVKKIKKGGGGHHGGAWKVAYADFVTAMMAFFLLMWLLGNTNEATREGIAEQFSNPDAAIVGPGGASTSMIDFGGAMDVPRSEGEPQNVKASEEQLADEIQEQAKLDELMRDILEQIESNPTLKDFKDQLKLDITSEGLRIQIVDAEKRPMFDLGSARLKAYTKEILHVLAKTIDQVPNHISVTGHTDAARFYPDEEREYSNWELSADRANAARRELFYGGLKEEKTGRVVGLADSVLFDKENPLAAVNRRISIIVLNRATEKAIGLDKLEAEAEPEAAETVPPAAQADGPIPLDQLFDTPPPSPLAPAEPPALEELGMDPTLADELRQVLEAEPGNEFVE